MNINSIVSKLPTTFLLYDVHALNPSAPTPSVRRWISTLKTRGLIKNVRSATSNKKAIYRVTTVRGIW